jgi:hypothetical protein
MDFLALLQDIVVLCLGGLFTTLVLMGSVAATEESSMRKKQMQEGTHDYYGNKIDN